MAMTGIISRRRAGISLAALAAAAAIAAAPGCRDRESSGDPVSAGAPSDVKQLKKEMTAMRASLAKMAPAKAYIVVDTHSNRIYLRTADKIMLDAKCSTGSGGEYVDEASGRHWIFETPHGIFKINSKIKSPWWRKPDWAFLEEGETIPKDEKERYDPEMMGDYAMGFGNGYFIHGTIYERLLGINVTHGCVRVGSEDLKVIFDAVPNGTAVFIF
jgi:L,D-transpeptidase YbiS